MVLSYTTGRYLGRFIVPFDAFVREWGRKQRRRWCISMGCSFRCIFWLSKQCCRGDLRSWSNITPRGPGEDFADTSSGGGFGRDRKSVVRERVWVAVGGGSLKEI